MSRDAWIQEHEKASAALYEEEDAKTTGRWVRIEKTYFEQCRTCANALGLTISSRCKLIIPKKPDDPAAADPLSSMLQVVTRERAEGENEKISAVCYAIQAALLYPKDFKPIEID